MTDQTCHDLYMDLTVPQIGVIMKYTRLRISPNLMLEQAVPILRYIFEFSATQPNWLLVRKISDDERSRAS